MVEHGGREYDGAKSHLSLWTNGVGRMDQSKGFNMKKTKKLSTYKEMLYGS